MRRAFLLKNKNRHDLKHAGFSSLCHLVSWASGTIAMRMKLVLWVGMGLFFAGTGVSAQDEKPWTLEACINFALEQNITVRKVGLSNLSLEYQSGQVKAQRFPSVNASVNQNFKWSRPGTLNAATGEMVYGSGFDASNSTSYGVNANVTLFNGMRLNNQIKQSELDIETGRYNLENTRESISLSILNAFLQVLYAEEQVKNSENQIESTTQQVALAEERMNLQVISQADFLQVKSQLATQKLNLANAISQLAIAKVNLMQLMELPVSQNFELAKPNLDETLNQQRLPVVQTVFDTALAIKPQVKIAAVNKEIALLDEKIARAAFYPSLSASASVGTGASFADNGSEDSYFKQLDHALSPAAGLSLSIPIYQRKQAKTSVALAQLNYQQAELSELETRNQLRKSIEQACQDVLSAQIEYEANLENYTAIKESAALSDEKFNQGIINSVDYQVSKTNLIVAESQWLQSKYNLIFSYKILDFYLGIPLTL
ncbi:MAG: TolC family protein [Bacteroidales bacterium]|nr:TolC family protein [Bacteroidales bacterium]